MKISGQGVRYNSSRRWLFLSFLLLVSFAVEARHVPATTSEETLASVSVIVAETSSLQKDISIELLQLLTEEGTTPRPAMRIRLIHAEKSAAFSQQDLQPATSRNLVVVIGADNIELARQLFPTGPYLYIVTDPGKLSPRDLDDDTGVLYMTQPFCRQLAFIHLLNPRWQRVSYLTSRTDYPDEQQLKQCASRLQLDILRQHTHDSEHLSMDLKAALKNSDLLLAIPDHRIYNRKTVKNILLTSYRMRKPVLAFSGSFVKAGAIASIYSTARQIADSARNIITRYLSAGEHTIRKSYYPERFDISINHQVFRALNLDIPDIPKIKSELTEMETENTPSTGSGQ